MPVYVRSLFAYKMPRKRRDVLQIFHEHLLQPVRSTPGQAPMLTISRARLRSSPAYWDAVESACDWNQGGLGLTPPQSTNLLHGPKHSGPIEFGAAACGNATANFVRTRPATGISASEASVGGASVGQAWAGQAWAGQAWAGASVAGASASGVGVAWAGQADQWRYWQNGPVSYTSAWQMQLGRKRQRSNGDVGHGHVHGQRIGRVHGRSHPRTAGRESGCRQEPGKKVHTKPKKTTTTSAGV